MPKVIGFDESKKHRATCRSCAAIIEYTKSETRPKTVSDYTGDRDTYQIINCPNCNAEVYT